MRARHVDEILGPQPLHSEQALLEALRRLFPRHAKSLEFDVAIADALAVRELRETGALDHTVETKLVDAIIQDIYNTTGKIYP